MLVRELLIGRWIGEIQLSGLVKQWGQLGKDSNQATKSIQLQTQMHLGSTFIISYVCFNSIIRACVFLLHTMQNCCLFKVQLNIYSKQQYAKDRPCRSAAVESRPCKYRGNKWKNNGVNNFLEFKSSQSFPNYVRQTHNYLISSKHCRNIFNSTVENNSFISTLPLGSESLKRAVEIKQYK